MTKRQEILANLDQSIDKIKNKEHKVIFMIPDTKGNARASVSNICRQAMTLKENNYNVAILLERKDSIKPSAWLGSEYDTLEYFSVEENNMIMGAHDFIIIPEIFGNVFEQIEKLPMEKIVFVQAYDYLLEPYAPGKSFLDYGVVNCLTTNDIVANMVSDIFRGINIKTIPVGIPEWFSPTKNLKKPIIAIHCRDAKKASKIIKTFYLKYPVYRFVSFKDMHVMSEKDMANNLKDCCLSIWVDDESSFGTFPVESMKCNVPVIGKIPNIIPEWMTDENGLWVYDENQILGLISGFIKNWLEDNTDEIIPDVNKYVDGKYTMEDFKNNTVTVFEEFFSERITRLEKIKSDLN